MAGNQPVDWSELTPDALLAHMAGLTILKKRIDKALGEAKRQYLRTHDADSPKENAVFAGTDAATVLVKKDGEGSYKVVAADERDLRARQLKRAFNRDFTSA